MNTIIAVFGLSDAECLFVLLLLVLLLIIFITRKQKVDLGAALKIMPNQCFCTHCGKGIEFEATQAGKMYQCPHCGTETRLAGERISQSENKIPPNYVTCSCQHCNGQIEFDSTGFQKNETRSAECPHCKMETLIFVPFTPKPPQAPPIVKKAEKPPPQPIPTQPSAQVHSVKGVILDFTIQTNVGIISGDDGKRYSFQGAEWRETGKFPTKGMRVDFSPLADSASAIYLIQDSLQPDATEKRDCNHVMAGLFGILLGWLGIHKFYMGQIQLGCVYILAGVVTCGWGFIITAIIGLVEGIIYLTMTQAEFDRKFILNPPGPPFQIKTTKK